MSDTPAHSLPSPADAAIELHFELSEQDLIEYWRDTTRLDPWVRGQWATFHGKRRRVLLIAIGLTSLLALGLALGYFGAVRIADHPLLATMLLLATVAMWWRVQQYQEAIAQADRTVASPARYLEPRALRYFCGPVSMSVGPTGVIARTSHADVAHRWSGITDVCSGTDMVYLRRGDGGCYMIPSRAWPTADEVSAAVSRMRGWLDASGHGDQREITAYLAGHDVPCPGCRYNLRGVSARECPECGRALDIGLIPVLARVASR